MAENEKLGIPLIPILCKPDADFVFIGRDPSPRTVTAVGIRGGRSVFINEIFEMVERAYIREERVYITDLCKCHWRTSKGTPYQGTEDRNTLLPLEIAEACIKNWLFKEIKALRPKIIFSFGEELYQQLKPYIVDPRIVPQMLSASKDKSILDAESYFLQNGPMKIQLGLDQTLFVPLRHPGSSISLPKNDPLDKRRESYNQSREKVIKIFQELKGH